MKLLIDINIVLDVLLNREPWSAEAAVLLSHLERGEVEGFVASHTLTTLYYIVRKAKGRRAAATAVTDLLRIVHVVPLADADFQQAIALDLDDFEDAVQAAAALNIGASFLITRNADDFAGIAVPVRSAGEILGLMEQTGQ